VEGFDLRPGQLVEGRFRPHAFVSVRRAGPPERVHFAEEIAPGRRLVAQDFLLDRSALVVPLRLRVEHVAHEQYFLRV